MELKEVHHHLDQFQQLVVDMVDVVEEIMIPEVLGVLAVEQEVFLVLLVLRLIIQDQLNRDFLEEQVLVLLLMVMVVVVVPVLLVEMELQQLEVLVVMDFKY
jgi:hypothetical protein